MAVLNNKLSMNGFKTLSEFVHAWIDGKYPVHQKDEQIEKLINRMREKDIKEPLTGEFSPTFYKNIDLEYMLQGPSKKYV